MDNILSPDQLSNIQKFHYQPIQTVKDPNLEDVQTDLKKVLTRMRKENDKVQEKVTTLQLLLDTLYPTQAQPKNDSEYIEEIKWDIYFYKKYSYQTHLLWVIIGVCILLNVYSFLPPFLFPGLAGFTLALAFIYMVYRIWDLMFRDDMNFDEYKFQEYTGSFNRPDNNTHVEVDLSNCVVRKDQYIPL